MPSSPRSLSFGLFAVLIACAAPTRSQVPPVGDGVTAAALLDAEALDQLLAPIALIACPARWDHSGVTSFLVGANGKVYQRDFGADSVAIAASMTAYDPSGSWTLVRE